jgi:hypothetical protein
MEGLVVSLDREDDGTDELVDPPSSEEAGTGSVRVESEISVCEEAFGRVSEDRVVEDSELRIELNAAEEVEDG